MLNTARAWMHRRTLKNRPIPDDLWFSTVAAHAFLPQPSSEPDANSALRALATVFLSEKQFTGAHGFVVTNPIVAAIAAQAVLPLLHMTSPGQAPENGWQATPTTAGQPLRTAAQGHCPQLDWYKDFVGIVVHAAPVVAMRSSTDAAGVVHAWREEVSGEAMEGGPIMLNWQDVQSADASAASGYNVVIHEFAHAIDMHGGGAANGCPLLWTDFMVCARHAASGSKPSSEGRGNTEPSRPISARTLWLRYLLAAHETFQHQLSLAERFGQPMPWLDGYAATSPTEFFAVTCEAYFVNPVRLRSDFPDICKMYDAFFRPHCQPTSP